MKIRNFLLLIISMMLITGCGSRREYQRNYYLIQTRGIPVNVQTQTGAALNVGRFDINQSFGTRNLVYSYGKNRFETDFYNTFMTAPDVMIAEQTRKWLNEVGLFKAVLPYSNLVQPSYDLKGYIEKLYADYSDRDSPKAVMEIRYYLLGTGRDRQMIFTKLYIAAVTVPSTSASDLVEGYGICLKQILTQLTDDLSKLNLQTTPKPNLPRSD